jgi:DNA-binding XRE family transcriptional regulator
MTGNHISELRAGLGLTAGDMAALLGVSTSTLYRWEAAGAKKIRIDPMQLRIISLLNQQLNALHSAQQSAELGQALGTALIVGGGMFALHQLLKRVYD